MLFFEVDPVYIGKPSSDKRIINVAEKDRSILSSHREFEPQVWKAAFS
jgi:hypothetical protein